MFLNSKVLLSILVAFFASLSLYGQPQRQIIDSLKKELNKQPEKTKQATLYSDLSWYYNQVSVDSALIYGNKAIHLAKELKDRKLIAQCLSDLGAIYYIKGDNDKSMDYYQQSLKIRTEDNDEEGIASLHFKIGNNYYKRMEFEKAMESYIKALKFYEEKDDKQTVATLKSNIANLYLSLKNYPKALEYLDSAEQYFEENKLYFQSANNNIVIGNTYFQMKDTLKAISFYEKTIQVADKSNNFNAKAIALNNIGSIYMHLNKNEQAVKYLKEALEIRKRENWEADVHSSYISLAINYNRLGNFSTSKELLHKSLRYFKEKGYREKLGDIYLQLIPIYAHYRQTDSVSHYINKYVAVQDEILNEKVISVSDELETKYQTEKKEKEILIQRAKIAESELKIEKKNSQIMGVVFLLIISVLIGFQLYNKQVQKNIRLKKENELKDALTKIEIQNQLQEQRLRISRDLHDNIGSQLTFIISSIDSLKYFLKGENPKVETKLNDINSFTRNTIVELRDTIWAMNKDYISYEDLKIRISNFIERAESMVTEINFSFYLDETLMKQQMSSFEGINIYRIIQEGVNNAIKHANPTQISVMVKQVKDTTQIIIEDNGNGFDKDQNRQGNGLDNIKKRVEDIGGLFSLMSLPERGTQLFITY